MGEFEDKLNSILDDPAQMEKIAGLARSLMGENHSDDSAPAQTSDTEDSMLSKLGDMAKSFFSSGEDTGKAAADPELMEKLGPLLKSGSRKDREERALLEAMMPYLSEKRRSKMDKALRLARLARIAGLAMGEAEEKRDV